MSTRKHRRRRPINPSSLFWSVRDGRFSIRALFHCHCHPLNVPRRAEPYCPRIIEVSFPQHHDPHVFRYDPMADVPIQFMFEPTDAGFLLAGVMIWIIGWVLTQAPVLKAEHESIV